MKNHCIATLRRVSAAQGENVPENSRRIPSCVYLAPAIVLLAIAAGLALRLSGFIGGAYSWFAFSATEDDSWLPMKLAFARVLEHGPGSLYDVFFIDHVKFQYPASSLLLHSAVSSIGIAPTHQLLSAIVWISIFVIPFVIYRLTLTVMDREDSHRLHLRTSDRRIIALSFSVGSLFFYPIMISYRLGQIQGLLDLLFALACLSLAKRATLTAGSFIGAVCLVKPQFALFLLWAGIRRQTYFAAAQITVLAAGSLLSAALYGLHDNIQYLGVLSYLSQHGESHWDNTSINGFVSRIIHPDLSFSREFPPFDMATYLITMVSSAAIVMFALLANRQGRSAGGLLDFMMAGLCFTLAAPIAWGHHYGVVMPILAVVFIEIVLRVDGARRRTLLAIWGVSFLLFSVNWNVTDVLGGTPLTFLQSWRLLAAIGLIWLVFDLQTDHAKATGQQNPITAPPNNLSRHRMGASDLPAR